MHRQITKLVSTRAVPVLCSFLLVLFADSGWACKCTPITVEEDFRASDIVFSGKVLQRGELKEGRSEDLLIEVKFDVVELWKSKTESDTDDSENSEKTSEMEVSTSAYTPSCGYPFKVGETYLVFADSSQMNTEGEDETPRKLLTTGLCSANQPLHDSFVTNALLDQLDELRSEFQGKSDDMESEKHENSHTPS